MEKAGKRHTVLDAEQNVDRLSALPEDVISHILSFLPTKLSVSTSILARRWRFLWAYVPVLDFDSCYHDIKLQEMSFPNIVCTVMLGHKVKSLNTFCLKSESVHFGPTCLYELETCIATAIDRNVQNLELHLQQGFKLPRCVLTCKTLVDLRLPDGVRIFPSSGPISLPSLKKLCFYSDESGVHLGRLLSGCPVLEELVIGGHPCSNLEGCSNFDYCTLFSSTLTSLTLSFLLNGNELSADCRLVINAPALIYLTVHYLGVCPLYHQISVSPMNSLVEADICLDTFGEFTECYPPFVLEFLDSLCNVKRLKLSGCDEEYLNILVPGSIAKFGNLTKLEMSANWGFLSKFLESADRLQVLIIREGGWHSKHWMEPMETRCACSLRTVRIDDFGCKEQGFNMVSYLLRNAQVLERMEIIGLKEKHDAIRRIASFHRVFEKCQLVFS